MGVGKGSQVGVLLPNGAGWVVAWAATTRIGAVVTPVNTFYKTPELATMLRHADVQVLIATPTFESHDYVDRLLDDRAGARRRRRTGRRPERNPLLLLPSLPQLRHIAFWEDDADQPWARRGIGSGLDDPVDDALATVVGPWRTTSSPPTRC